MSVWVDKYGEPFADYELRAIEVEENPFLRSSEGIALLGFSDQSSMFMSAASCQTCGQWFMPFLHFLRAHRRICGWDNGSPAIKETP